MSVLVASGADSLALVAKAFERQILDQPEAARMLTFFGQVPVDNAGVPPEVRALLLAVCQYLIVQVMEAYGIADAVEPLDDATQRLARSWVFDAGEQ